MTESMTDFLNLNTRTRHLKAETRDLEEMPPANHPVSVFPLLGCVSNRQPLTADAYLSCLPGQPADGSTYPALVRALALALTAASRRCHFFFGLPATADFF